MPSFDLDVMMAEVVGYRSNDTEVLFNDDDYIKGDSALTYDYLLDTLGLKIAKFADNAAAPTITGQLVRHGADLKFYDGTASRTLLHNGDIPSESDPVFAAWLALPPNVSIFANDAGYLDAETDPVYSANTYAVGMNQGVATTDSPAFVGMILTPNSPTFDGLNLEMGDTYAPWMKFYAPDSANPSVGTRYHIWQADSTTDSHAWVWYNTSFFQISMFYGDASVFGYDPAFAAQLAAFSFDGVNSQVALGYDANTLGYLTGLWAARREGADGTVIDIFSFTDIHIPTVPEGSEAAIALGYWSNYPFEVVGARIAVGQEVTDNWNGSAGINESGYLSLKTLFGNDVTERLRITGYGDVVVGIATPNRTGIDWDFFTGTTDWILGAHWQWGYEYSLDHYVEHYENGTETLVCTNFTPASGETWIIYHKWFSTTIQTGDVVISLGGVTGQTISITGIEKVVNGDFGAAGTWTYGTDWSYDATNHEADHATNGTGLLQQDIGVEVGKRYYLTYTVKNRTAGSVTPTCGGVGLTIRSANGTYTEKFIAESTGTLQFLTTNTARLSVDDVSVIEEVSGIYRDVFKCVSPIGQLTFTPSNTFRGRLCFCIAIKVVSTGNIVANDGLFQGGGGFWGVTPTTAQPGHIIDATDLATCITRIAAILSVLEKSGQTASS
jgi:hypothetical protein